MLIAQTAKIDNEIMRIFVDECPESPREWDNLGKMVCWHRRYNLGDKHEFDKPQDFNEYINKQKAVVLPIYMYDHGGITISTTRNYPFNCRWDAGQLGFIYATYEDIRKTFMRKHVTQKLLERTKQVLLNEVEAYDTFLRGDIYGFEIVELIKCEHCGNIEEETKDSCCGFFGSDFDKNGIFEHAGEKWKNAEWKEEN